MGSTSGNRNATATCGSLMAAAVVNVERRQRLTAEIIPGGRVTFQSIENYGIIGNLCTAALVGIDSSIDFFCFPEFDSPTVFAALLDPVRGGSFSIRPQIDAVQSKQMYAAETNVLLTRFLSEGAIAELIDFMPLTANTHKNELVRVVR